MPAKWRVKLLRSRSAIKGPITVALKNSIQKFHIWLATDFKFALVFGGMGIEGIAQTPFYQWISSSDGLSQLGIPPSEPPRLLEAYLKTFRVDTRGYTTRFEFGNVYNLLQATPHPANGTGKLNVGSWMAWAINGKTVNNYGYVPRSRIPKGGLRKRIRLNDPLGGLMLKSGSFGSTGSWQIPQVLQTYADQWFLKNQAVIENVMAHKMEEILIRAFN